MIRNMAKRSATRSNLKTALGLGSIALVFFFGVMLKYWLQNHQ